MSEDNPGKDDGTGKQGDGDQLLDSLGVTAVNAAQLETSVLAKVGQDVLTCPARCAWTCANLTPVGNYFSSCLQAAESLKDASNQADGGKALLHPPFTLFFGATLHLVSLHDLMLLEGLIELFA